MIDFDELKQRILDRIFSRIIENWQSYIDEVGIITIDEESVYETVFDLLFPIAIPAWQREKFFEEVGNSVELENTFLEAKQAAEETARDMKDWAKGPLHYYGLRQHDFI